jgi:hypothetical protein
MLTYQDLPDMPLAGAKVANELTAICTDKTCLHLNDWLNELYLFKQEYKIHKREL